MELAAQAHAERCRDGWAREVTVFGVVKIPCVLCPVLAKRRKDDNGDAQEAHP